MGDAKSPAGFAEKLHLERQKALELLEKSQSPLRETTARISYLFRPFRSEEATSAERNTKERKLSVNISDLAEDKTVDLCDAPENLTFDPQEITGRSTMESKKEILSVNFEDILSTSRFQSVRELSRSHKESVGREKFPTRRISQRETINNSFQSDDFVSSESVKRNLLSEDEREWEKEFFAVPGVKYGKPQEVDFDGLSGFMIPHNTSSASEQFSLGAFCNRQNECIANMISAESPEGQVARGLLNSTVSSVASTATIGKTYTAESKEDDEISSLIKKLLLQDSTSKILAEHFAKESRKSTQKAPLDDITTKDHNLQPPERLSEDLRRTGKENHKEKEYQEFCRFRSSKSPRRTGSHTTLTLSDSLDDRRSSTRVEGLGARKRSRSSVFRTTDAAPAVCRRAKSPENTVASDRMFLLGSPMDSSKMSLPSYGLVKEKSPASAGLTRTASQMSTASEFNHREGYLPLKATHGALSWGSLRLRTSVTKSIQIKNTAAKRLVFRAVIDGPGFQFGGSGGTDAPQMTITLQPQECRAIRLVFCPTVKGPAVGKLEFKPPSDNVCVNRVIPLYGYGGHASVTLEGLQQGPVGSKFLPIGDMRDITRGFEQTIVAMNKGSLSAFVNVNVEKCRPDQQHFITSVTVTPSKVVIPPSRGVKIRVEFKPRRDEVKKLLEMQKSQDVVLIANLLVITGDEPTRHRMKKLIKGMPKHALATSKVLGGLWTNFPRENDESLDQLRENSEAIADLAEGYRSIEIALTINNGADDTVMDASGWVADFEETILFKTITPGNEPNMDVDEVSIEPTEIIWECTKRETRMICLESFSDRKQMFRIETNQPHLVDFLPSSGELLPHEKFTIMLKLMPGPQSNKFSIVITVGDRVVTIPVHGDTKY